AYYYNVYTFLQTSFMLLKGEIHGLPSREERMAAVASKSLLATVLAELEEDSTEIEFENFKQKITIPRSALKLLSEILEAMSEGKAVTIMPLDAEMTTQAAAEILGCSRPHLVKLLESGEIPFIKVGRHRRVRFEEVRKYKEKMIVQRREALQELMEISEELGLYDS
ncbi:MAG: helix-turn-helix domain-containing protein, partial [Bacteroidota bacterium]